MGQFRYSPPLPEKRAYPLDKQACNGDLSLVPTWVTMKPQRPKNPAALRRAAELRLKAKSADSQPTTKADPRRLQHELDVHQSQLELQNEELRATQAKLEAALAQYTELYDFVPAGYFTLARDSTIRQANLMGAGLLGIERSRLLNQRLAGFVAAEARSAFGGLLARAFETKAPQSGEIMLSIRGKPPLTVLLQASVTGDGQECRVVLTDLTERKQAQEALRKSKTILEAVNEGTTNLICMKDRQGKVIMANPAMCRFLGKTESELVGGDDLVLFTDGDLATQIRETDCRVMDTRCAETVDETICLPGRQRTCLFTKSPCLDARGDVVGVIGIGVDITERTRMEEAVRESEERFRAMFEMASIGIAQSDVRTGQWLSVNLKMCEITGYSASELLQMRVPEFTHPEDRQRDWDAFQRVVRGEQHDDRLEKRYVRKDGSLAWVNVNMTVLRDAAGGPTRTMATIEDITERKQAEAALRESESLLRESQAIAGLGNYVTDILTERWKSSEVLDQVFGIDPAYDHSVAGWVALIHPEDHAIMLDYFNNEVLARGQRFDKEYRIIRHSDQAVRWVHGLGRLEFDPEGRPRRMLGTIQDITERKQVEQELRASEVRYRRLFEAAKDGVLVLDAGTGMVVDVNPFLVQLLGFPREAFVGKRIWELGCFKDIVASQDHFKELQEAEYIRYDDRPLRTADGRRIDVEFVSNVYQVNRQKVIQCNIRDITERKLIEWRGLIYKDQLRALSARVETMREEERTRISREIHDELGQMLTGIKMDLRWMEHRLDEFGDDRRANPILDKLVATAELTDATVKTVQRIAAELRPGILDKLGLPMALQYEAARFEERTGIACRLVVPDDSLALPPEAATAFFRVFQEALTNVSRHAKATAVEAELQPEADGCRLVIRDNGQGMAWSDLENPKSLGLLGMKERAGLLGGGVSFAPRPGGGTVVTVRIPYNPPDRGGV